MDGVTWATQAKLGDEFARLVGPEGWRRLHPDIRRRFAADHDLPIIYRGRMTVWCSAIGRIMAFGARVFGAPLTGWREVDIETTAHVANEREGVAWTRVFHRGDGRQARVRSVKQLDTQGRLLECVEGGLGMWLAVREDGGGLVFESHGYFLAIGNRRIGIPSLFTPGRCRVSHIVVGPRHFRFSLDMTHPVWGRCFTQDGVFEDPEGE